jgi:SAM-dependent methyltransferase
MKRKEENKVPWHEQDDFWIDIGSVLFSMFHQTDTPAEIDKIVSLTGIKPGMAVLDLGCGIGRHSLELARQGYSVTGVDRTDAYLKTARENAGKEGLNVEFIRQDMREFRRPNGYDAVISMFTSFGYFEDPDDDRQVADNMFACLRPNGVLLIDVAGQEIVKRIWQDKDWHENEDVFLLEERSHSDDWSWCESRWILFKDGIKTEQRFSNRLYSAQMMTSLLLQTGFSRTEIYGSLAGTPYDETAQRLVVVGRK